MPSCSVQGCERGLYTKLFCSRHYNRLRKTGTTDDGPRARLSFKDRFWRHVRRSSEDDCWNWTGSGVDGYGTISEGGKCGKKILSHRASWEIHFGPIPPNESEHHGTVVRHSCNNRACVNPKHLMLGTQADNVDDMWKPGDHGKGNARLTEAQIEAIRSDPRSSRKLAPEYGVCDAHIRSIRNGRAWS